MDASEREVLRRRAMILLNRIISPEQFEDAIEWGDVIGDVRLNVLMLERRAELLRLWQAFTAAGSATTARALIAPLAVADRRLFLQLLTTTFDVCFEGGRMSFLGGPEELEVPQWFLRAVL